MGMNGTRAPFLAATALALVSLLAACGPAAPNSSGSGAAAPGSNARKDLTVVEVNQTWPNLDPVLSPVSGLAVNYFNAIYGQLFRQLPDGKIEPDLAQAYQYSDDYKTFSITLRPGLTFHDGTPLNAEAVAFSMRRELDPSNACLCLNNFRVVDSIDTQGDTTVILHLSRAYAPFLQSFIAQAPNYVLSPTAFSSMGASAFAQAPVGAGPFKVVSNVASAELNLARFDKYWQAGQPYLDTLKFITTPNDQSAYAAVQSGQAQLVIGITTQSILDQAKAQFQVPETPGTQTQDLVFNTYSPPFNNIVARQAVAYAINSQELLNVVSPGFGVTVEDQAGPGGLFYQQTVPGFRHYDLAKAKELVQQLGGLSVVLTHSTNTAVFATLGPAIGNQLTAAGIQVSYRPTSPTQAQQMYAAGDFQVNPSNAGATDPSISANGFATRFGSKGTFTCCKDPKLDEMIAQAEETVDTTERQKVMSAIYQYISDNQYVVPLFSLPTALVAAQGLAGIEGTSNGNAATEMVQWANVVWK